MRSFGFPRDLGIYGRDVLTLAAVHDNAKKSHSIHQITIS